MHPNTKDDVHLNWENVNVCIAGVTYANVVDINNRCPMANRLHHRRIDTEFHHATVGSTILYPLRKYLKFELMSAVEETAIFIDIWWWDREIDSPGKFVNIGLKFVRFEWKAGIVTLLEVWGAMSWWSHCDATRSRILYFCEPVYLFDGWGTVVVSEL